LSIIPAFYFVVVMKNTTREMLYIGPYPVEVAREKIRHFVASKNFAAWPTTKRPETFPYSFQLSSI